MDVLTYATACSSSIAYTISVFLFFVSFEGLLLGYSKFIQNHNLDIYC